MNIKSEYKWTHYVHEHKRTYATTAHGVKRTKFLVRFAYSPNENEFSLGLKFLWYYILYLTFRKKVIKLKFNESMLAETLVASFAFLAAKAQASVTFEATLLAEDETVLSHRYLKLSEDINSGSSFNMTNYLVEVCEPRKHSAGRFCSFIVIILSNNLNYK
ncbi:hypothetical protein HanHA300_Chr03g0107241 [Helianthus annuus]|nr:hypothetical protein HanHA300_Chr03g0107241 [Helianthus annuus]KAJ0775132.1 hypothetical protein HanOQP8_Chr03g0119531 [Helianthus annuus]